MFECRILPLKEKRFRVGEVFWEPHRVLVVWHLWRPLSTVR
jgi:hypothetical protein